MQIDLDGYLGLNIQERAHQGRDTNGRTPYQAFIEGIIHDEKEDVQAVG